MYIALDYRTIGGRIRQTRIKHSMTQAQLAEAAEMSEAHICRIETGARKIGLEGAAKISAALGITLDFLVFGVVSCPCENPVFL